MRPGVGRSPDAFVIGGGLAGCEASWQLARAGLRVRLIEMRPGRSSPAHTGGMLAELVCSNSLRSDSLSNAVGLLKRELREAGSLLLSCADACRVPAGGALAVDRERFSGMVTSRVGSSPLIELVRREVEDLDDPRLEEPLLVATGPLTSPAMSRSIERLTGCAHLYFYDAIAPVVESDSIDRSVVFEQSRYGRGEGSDYLNCPMDRETYDAFVSAVSSAGRTPPRVFEAELHFGGCLPVEVIAASGGMALAHGPMKPVGLVDPTTDRRPWAVVQLRRENEEGSAWNMVGFQTRLTGPEQRRVFRMIPGLERARFLRLGSMHRNTFIDSPRLLDERLRLRGREGIRFTGQITGVEGYVESIASGLVAGILLASDLRAAAVEPPPVETALGSLMAHLRKQEPRVFQPSNVNYSMMESPPEIRGRREKRAAIAERSARAMAAWVERTGELLGWPT
ncbi:methylenetetrahydrofolate--tRNA-(uracil(54)-C(5))-methyltransferase (FADH(2)-oxidizing) TrmFO [Candidatus Fermentibacterales bacterium]|nr:methylenetetrahydrofolate--tRNA-(uracil(54)-C(5))-methyltransferase (FADH(2)-oxidizing) TrmFO [Candidatus Fermentibacterales bacterium]